MWSVESATRKRYTGQFYYRRNSLSAEQSKRFHEWLMLGMENADMASSFGKNLETLVRMQSRK
jgi:hypothetical protein